MTGISFSYILDWGGSSAAQGPDGLGKGVEPTGDAGLTSITWGQTQIAKGKGLLGCCE